MKEDKFFKRIREELEYLAKGKFSFDTFLRMSQKDRRIRNAFVFYVLSDRENFNRFKILSQRSLFVRRLNKYLLQSLIRVEKEELYRDELRSFARYIRDNYLDGESTVLEKYVYDPSVEMEKFFVSVANHILNESDTNEERNKYAQQILADVDYENLFVEH